MSSRQLKRLKQRNEIDPDDINIEHLDEELDEDEEEYKPSFAAFVNPFNSIF